MSVVPSAVSGAPRLLLRVEGAAPLCLATILYAGTGDSWWLFAILFLAPDLSFLGYLGGSNTGAILYNAVHTLTGPLLLAAIGLLFSVSALVTVALIWVAHIGFDRLVGYGLKYGAGFNYTHLDLIGRMSADKT
jgi:hypothetical protein